MGVNDQAQCVLPGCDAFLQITCSQSGIVFEDGTVDTSLTSTWVIGCAQGHVLLLPVDDAADYHFYEVPDSARLRDLMASVVS